MLSSTVIVSNQSSYDLDIEFKGITRHQRHHWVKRATIDDEIVDVISRRHSFHPCDESSKELHRELQHAIRITLFYRGEMTREDIGWSPTNHYVSIHQRTVHYAEHYAVQ
jgi:hypothetical protein